MQEQREEEQRQREEQQRLKREQESRELRLCEQKFWAALTLDEAERMRSLLQAVALFQQQVAENEILITDLQDQTSGKERACRATQRRTQQAGEEAQRAKAQESRHLEEIARWSRKCTQIKGLGDEAIGTDALRARVESMQAERERLREQKAGYEKRYADAQHIDALRADRKLSVEAHKAAHAEDLAALVPVQTAEISELETKYDKEMSQLQIVHSGQSAELNAALEGAARRRDAHGRERDDAQREHDARQQENVLLHQDCSDERQEVLHFSTEVKEAMWRAEAASPYGDLLELAEAEGSDSETEEYAEDLRLRCRQLQRECARTHDALDKKQAEAERWRSRRLLRMGRGEATCDSEPFVLG